MRLDQVQVAVRPRNVLESLDLALLVCGRRPLGLFIAAAIGAVPMILLNRTLFAGMDMDPATPWVGLATALEMPWAAAPLTLYLGQVMFAERFDRAAWRHCLRAFAGSIGPMVLYQAVCRGMVFLSCLGAPIWIVLAYFLGPVILLERGRWSRTTGRAMALCRAELPRIPLLLFIDALLLGVGWWLGVTFLETFAWMWRGEPLNNVPAALVAPFAEDGDVAAAAMEDFVSWTSQIAFWTAAAAVTIYRFFTYLDARIRHEGWDLELKFRAPRTYAGLRPAARVAAGAALLAAVAAGTCGAAPHTDPTTVAEASDTAAATGAGTAVATASNGAEARDALAKQRFPWYDADADAVRPMVRVERPPTNFRRETAEIIGMIAKSIMIAVLVLLVAGAVWLLVRHGLDWRPGAGRTRAAAATVLGAEALEALPEAARRHDGDLLAEAARLAAAGDFATAMVFFQGWQLVQLHGRGAIELARGKTNRRYAAEVAASEPALHALFRRSNRLFEDALFGRLPVAAADFAAVWDRRDEFRAPRVPEAGA
jgi:hypothetical protein